MQGLSPRLYRDGNADKRAILYRLQRHKSGSGMLSLRRRCVLLERMSEGRLEHPQDAVQAVQRGLEDSETVSSSLPRYHLPPEESDKVQFFWIEVKDDTHLVAHHSVIDAWKTATKGQYKQNDRTKCDPVTIHALSLDPGLQGKRFGHGIRVAFWSPPGCELENSGRRGDFNRTAFALAHPKGGKNIASLKYGPVIAFAYTLDSEFEFDRMDDMTTNDFRHVIDYFRNSHWNPTVGDVKRYPQPTIPAQFIPDTTDILRDDEEAGDGKCYDSFALKIDAYATISRQDIPATLNDSQGCLHLYCDGYVWPIPDMCLSGYVWQTFLLGPAMLGLPWIGRNAVISDIHNKCSSSAWPKNRWKLTSARYLRQSFHTNSLGGMMASSMGEMHMMNMTDELLVFHAFGMEILPQHLEAYDQFIFQNLKKKGRGRRFIRAEFVKFWEQWKKQKAEVAELRPDPKNPTDPDEYRNLPSPYDVAPSSPSVLPRDMTAMLSCVTDLFDDAEFRADFQKDEYVVLESDHLYGHLFPKNLKPYVHQLPDCISKEDIARATGVAEGEGRKKAEAKSQKSAAKHQRSRAHDQGDKPSSPESSRGHIVQLGARSNSPVSVETTDVATGNRENKHREAGMESSELGGGDENMECDLTESIAKSQDIDLAALAAASLNLMERSEMMKLGWEGG